MIRKSSYRCLPKIPENIPIILDRLESEDFFSPRNKDIFSAIKALYERELPIEALSISTELKQHGKEIGSSEIIELEEHFFDGYVVEYHIEQLKVFSRRRKLEIFLTEALTKIKDLSVENSELEEGITQGITSILNDRLAFKGNKLSLPTLSDIYDLNIEDEWLVDKLIPKEAITLLHGRGGLGKTWLLLQVGSCIADGKPFCGLSTIKGNVYYVDFENPMSVLHQRSRILGRSSLQVWHVSHNPPPPRLDESKWISYKSLPTGLIIFDSMRSAHLLDENSSKDMTLIMSRMKELRELGHTIIALLHAPKGDARTYRGSTAP